MSRAFYLRLVLLSVKSLFGLDVFLLPENIRFCKNLFVQLMDDPFPSISVVADSRHSDDFLYFLFLQFVSTLVQTDMEVLNTAKMPLYIHNMIQSVPFEITHTKRLKGSKNVFALFLKRCTSGCRSKSLSSIHPVDCFDL